MGAFMAREPACPLIPWFDDQAEAAAKFYVSLFNNSKILNVIRYGDDGPKVTGRPEGSVMIVSFQLDGQEFTALNGGPHFKFTEAISLVVNCATQKEVDYYWAKLSKGGTKSQCGWLKDKYGLSWQVVPTAAIALLFDQDLVRSQRVKTALYKMSKLDIKKLERAYAGR